MATKAEVLAWMDLWRHQEEMHRNELNAAGVDAYSRGYQDALADVQQLRLRDRVFKKRIAKVSS